MDRNRPPSSVLRGAGALGCSVAVTVAVTVAVAVAVTVRRA